MIHPVTSGEHRYCLNLASLAVRAQQQSVGGDEAGSKQLMAARRGLLAKGAATYAERHAGLVEYADVLAAQQPRPARLDAFLAAQQARITPTPGVADDPAPEPVTTKRVRKSRTKKES